jgi:hypothetical protein
VTVVLDDLRTLPPKGLEKRLERLARDSLPCHQVSVFDGNTNDGITVALHLDSLRRGDLLDLSRVVEDDPRVHGSADWSLLSPARRHHEWRLLLRISFERPVQCALTVRFDVQGHSSDPLAAALPLLLAANRFALMFDQQLDAGRPLVWIGAPVARNPVLELLSAIGVRSPA